MEKCPKCGRPEINDSNIRLFRKRMWISIGSSALVGGILGAIALPLLGFGLAGVGIGSIAAAWQSSMGGVIVAGSLFATLQSLGATGMGILLFGSIGTITSGGAMTLFVQLAKKLGWCACTTKTEPNQSTNKDLKIVLKKPLLDEDP